MKNLILHAIEDVVMETQQLGEMIVEDPVLQEHLSGLHPQVARAANRIHEGALDMDRFVGATEKQFERCRSTHISRPKQRVSTMDNSVQQYKTVDRDEKEQG